MPPKSPLRMKTAFPPPMPFDKGEPPRHAFVSTRGSLAAVHAARLDLLRETLAYSSGKVRRLAPVSPTNGTTSTPTLQLAPLMPLPSFRNTPSQQVHAAACISHSSELPPPAPLSPRSPGSLPVSKPAPFAARPNVISTQTDHPAARAPAHAPVRVRSSVSLPSLAYSSHVASPRVPPGMMWARGGHAAGMLALDPLYGHRRY